ncbi:hypothetical protein EU546_01530 [Candidatus Thorarchaeota archaeon]|nr:MAG: hypothetical protein EU546_01530 [Candidatus Thorarchaeota archaeon]
MRRQKVFAYITSEQRLLVITEQGFEHFRLQIPARPEKKSESLEQAVLRESQKVTGLEEVGVAAILGSVSMGQKKYGLNEIHDRHFFHLVYDGPTKEQWQHVESESSVVAEHTPETIVFDGSI